MRSQRKGLALTVDQRGECEANRVTGGIAERRDNRVAADAKRTKAKSLRKVAAAVEEQRCWHGALLCFTHLSCPPHLALFTAELLHELRRECLTEPSSH
jgi:hypothetical protein